jgi:hypothetical protein
VLNLLSGAKALSSETEYRLQQLPVENMVKIGYSNKPGFVLTLLEDANISQIIEKSLRYGKQRFIGRAFMSYSRLDQEFTLRLARELRNKGVPIWIDQLDIRAGLRWDREIEAALKVCRALIVMLTPTAVMSENVMDEVDYALEHGKKIVPVLKEKCDVPLRLRRLQQVDFTTNEADVSRLITELAMSE